MTAKTLAGFYHYRNDIGDGTRTGVVFPACHAACEGNCIPFSFPVKRQFFDLPMERETYTPEELIQYLREEKALLYHKRLGITFLGGEPMSDPYFCYLVAEGLSKADLDLHIWTCGQCEFSSYSYLLPLTRLFVVQWFYPTRKKPRPYFAYHQDRCLENIRRMDREKYPYRIRIPVVDGINTQDAERFAEEILMLENVKSVMLDFSRSGLNPDEILSFRREFLTRKIPLF